MSTPPEVRRKDKLMSPDRIAELLATGYSGHLGTVGPDGMPYVCPLLYIWKEDRIWVHNTAAPGHLQNNVRHDPRACFEIDQAGTIYPYGRFQCDTSIEYRSVVLFGRLDIIDDRPSKTAFFDGLLAKYYPADTTRPAGFYPRLDDVTVYALSVERMTGKETRLPAPESRWPAVDNTKSPHLPPGKPTPMQHP